jgi:hypothetical protein
MQPILHQVNFIQVSDNCRRFMPCFLSLGLRNTVSGRQTTKNHISSHRAATHDTDSFTDPGMMDEAQLLAKYGGLKPKARLIMKVSGRQRGMPSGSQKPCT